MRHHPGPGSGPARPVRIAGPLAMLMAGLLAALLTSAVDAPARPSRPPAVAELPVRLAQAGEVTIAYRETGAGPPLLLITGYGCAMDAWDSVLVAALAARHRVILYDNRGIGASTATDAPFSVGLFAGDATGLLEALGIARADVLGWSMGAMVALELALNHPERVGRLVLVGAAHDRDTVLAAVARMGAMSREELLASLFPPAWRQRHPGAAKRLPRSRTPVPAAVTARQREALAGWPGLDARLPGLDTPVLLVVGREDWVTPVRESEALARLLPASRLVRLKQSGHWLMYQDPAGLARLINRFLGRS